MEDNQIMEWMREIVQTCDHKNGAISHMRDEITMWRNRFLESLPIDPDTKKAALIYSHFSYTSSIEMCKQSPEELIKIIVDHYENSKK